MIRLKKRFVTFKIGIITYQMWELFHDENQTDGSQHALNYGIGNIITNNPGFDKAKDELK